LPAAIGHSSVTHCEGWYKCNCPVRPDSEAATVALAVIAVYGCMTMQREWRAWLVSAGSILRRPAASRPPAFARSRPPSFDRFELISIKVSPGLVRDTFPEIRGVASQHTVETIELTKGNRFLERHS
jgi:hypothetical protein